MGHAAHLRNDWFERHHYGLLLASLLVVYAIYPFTGSRPWILATLQAATVVMMVAALAAVRYRRILFWLGIVVAVLVTTLQVVHRFVALETTGIGANAVEMLFLLIIIVAITSGIMSMRQVTMNGVFAVCSIYLLLALTWANVYEVLELSQPGSFHRPAIAQSGSPAQVIEQDLLYFSLITMATVGYGDITPTTPPARSLSALQGVIGQLFLAIFLARIVSMEIGDRMAQRGGSNTTGGPAT